MYLFLDNQQLIEWGGVGLILALVFIETGFLIGLIVPGGETLLFTAGLLCGTHTLQTPIIPLVLLLILAAIAGDVTGYFIGKKLGNKLHTKKDSFIFKKKYLEQAENFFKKHGKLALLLGRFLPIVRTFNPVFSGSTHMELKAFLPFTALGCVLYISSITIAGYFLGNAFPQIQNYIKYIFMGVVVAVLIPLIIKLVKEKRKSTSEA